MDNLSKYNGLLRYPVFSAEENGNKRIAVEDGRFYSEEDYKDKFTSWVFEQGILPVEKTIREGLQNKIFNFLSQKGSFLTLDNISGLTSFPTWVFDFDSLRSRMTGISFQRCDKLISLPDFREFQHLVSITISGCPELSFFPMLPIHMTQIQIESSVKFAVIPELNYPDLNDLQLFGYTATDFPDLKSFKYLRRLALYECPNLTKVSNSSSNNVLLESLHIGRCPKFETMTSLDNCKGLKIFFIKDCPAIERLDLSIFPGLEEVDIESCHGVKHGVIKDNSKLTRVHIADCSQLETIECSGVSSLQILRIETCSSFQIMPGIDCPALTKLDLSKCPNLRSLPPLKDFTQLEELNLSECKGLEQLPADILSLPSSCEVHLKGWNDDQMDWLRKASQGPGYKGPVLIELQHALEVERDLSFEGSDG